MNTHILKSANGLVDIARREIIELFIMAENDDGNIHGTEDGELMRFLEQTSFALQKGSKSWHQHCFFSDDCCRIGVERLGAKI